MENIILTDLGTIGVESKEMKVDDFLKRIQKGRGIFYHDNYTYYDNDFSFNKDNESFDVCLTFPDDAKFSYSLVLSDSQKELLRQGRPSPEFLKLLAYSEKLEYNEKQKQVLNEFYFTGDLPSDPVNLPIYRDALKRKLKETNSQIAKGSIATSIIPLSFIAIPALYLSNNSYSFKDIAAACAIGAMVAFLSTAILLTSHQGPFRDESLIQSIKQRRVIKDRIKLLNEAIKQQKTITPEGLENKSIKKATENSNVFLKESELIKKKIAILPEDEREQYINELISIVNEYDIQVTNILDNKLGLGSAANIWDLNVSMLPRLVDLGTRLDIKLSTIKERQELKDTIERFKNSVIVLDSNVEELTTKEFAYVGR